MAVVDAGYDNTGRDASLPDIKTAEDDEGLAFGMMNEVTLPAASKPARHRTFRMRGAKYLVALTLGCAVLGGCAEQFQKGYILPEGALEQIPIGASQDQVLIVMGTPSTVATLSGEVFYYISQRAQRRVAFMDQATIDRRVIAVYFDRNRQVERVANYGMQDGKIFDFVSRTTPTSGQEVSYLTPLFRLIGGSRQ